MSIKTTKFIVAPLRGMDQRWEARPNHASYIQNMTWSDQDSWRSSVGYRRLRKENRIITDEGVSFLNRMDADPIPSSLYWFSQHGNALQWLMYEDHQGNFRYFYGSSINGPMGSNYGTSNIYDASGVKIERNCLEEQSATYFTMYGSNLYMVNGIDAPIVFDGRKATRAGFSGKPIAPEAFFTPKGLIAGEFKTGVGYKDSNNQYKYVVTFVNERGQESRFSNPSGKLDFDTKAEIAIVNSIGTAGKFKEGGTYRRLITVNIPTGPPGTVARRIYRTQNMVSFFEEIGGSSGGVSTTTTEQLREAQYGREFYFVTEIQDNVCKVFQDQISDVELGSLSLDEDFGDFPRNATMLAVFKNTMFVAGEMNEELRYSRPMHPEVFPFDNVFNLSDNQTSLITGMYATGDSLVVFKHRAIYLVKGDPVTGFFAQTLTTDIGCICNESIREVPGVGLLFLANDGIYVLEGTYSTASRTKFFKLSQGLRNIFGRVNTQFAHKFRSVINHTDREYWLSVCLDSDISPNTLIKFSYEIGAWSVYTDMPNVGMIEVQDHRSYIYFAGNSSSVLSGGARGLYVYGGSNTNNIPTTATGPQASYNWSPSQIESVVKSRTSIYETVNINFNGNYENFSPARVQARVVSYGNSISMEVYTNRDSDTKMTTSATATQLRPLEDQDFPLYGTAVFDGSNVYREHRPIICRFDFSTANKGPVNEIRLIFTSPYLFEIINYELEARLGRSRDIINLTEKLGGGITR